MDVGHREDVIVRIVDHKGDLKPQKHERKTDATGGEIRRGQNNILICQGRFFF